MTRNGHLTAWITAKAFTLRSSTPGNGAMRRREFATIGWRSSLLARTPASHARRFVSIEGVQSKLQRAVRLALEHVRGDAREVRGLAILVLAFGAPVCRAVDDLVIAPRIDHLKFVVRYAAVVQPGEELLDRRWTRRHLVAWR